MSTTVTHRSQFPLVEAEAGREELPDGVGASAGAAAGVLLCLCQDMVGLVGNDVPDSQPE